jgi:hypothetical protein
MELIRIGDIEVEVSFKEIKNLHLSVHPPMGKVTVSSPLHFDVEKIRLYVATKLLWIKKERKKIIDQERETDKDFITRESHYFLGKRYLLEISELEKRKVVLHHSKIELFTPFPSSVESKKQVLYNWYRKELRKVVQELIEQYSKKMEISFPEFGIRHMRTKWGSCATNNRRLWFNIELAKKPFSCIEYIVVHELVHLSERRHNKNFILLMNRYLPNWQVQKKLLNELPV